MIKKVLLGLGTAAMLFTASCKKDDDGQLAGNTWTVDEKKYTASTVTVDPVLGLISAVDGNNSLDVSFKTLPTATADFTVSDEPYTEYEASVKSIISGSFVYNSIGGDGSFVIVRVTDGKYSVLMNKIVVVNADNKYDTVRVSAHIVQ